MAKTIRAGTLGTPPAQICALAVILLGISGVLSDQGYLQAAGRIDQRSSNPSNEQILHSTIQIEMFEYARVEGEVIRTDVTQGLGTLVQIGEESFIRTHNHWPLIGTQLQRVELRSTSGELLARIEGATFRTRIRYQDGGTLLVQTPSLGSVVPASLGDARQLAPGDELVLAARDMSDLMRVTSVAAELVAPVAQSVLGYLKLKGSPAAIARGDSGGGVWFEDKLVANIWAIVETSDINAITGGRWAGCFSHRSP